MLPHVVGRVHEAKGLGGIVYAAGGAVGGACGTPQG